MSDLYGLFGEKLSHSLSPQIHSKVFSKLNMKGYYHLFELKSEDLGTAVAGLKVLKARGINVTIPYKIQVMNFLDELSKEAKALGAVNTIKFEKDKTIGYNTDYFGLKMLFEKNEIAVKDKKALILGNGGVAVTVVQFLLDSGISEITIATIDKDLNKDIPQFGYCKMISFDEIPSVKADILVNCTPVGMYPAVNNSPVDKKYICNFSTAVDMIYNPKKTLFLQYAEEAGLKAVNGLYMLVGQGIASQEIWNDIKIPKSVIDEIYEELEKVIGE